jgi:hypothetical protein
MMGRYDDAASLLRRDLNREEVKNNLDFYRSLQPLDSRQPPAGSANLWRFAGAIINGPDGTKAHNSGE